MGESNYSRDSSSSSPRTTSSRNGDLPKISDLSGPAISTATRKPKRSSESDLEQPSLEQMAEKHANKQEQHQREIDIHSDGRFMSALKAIHDSKEGEAPITKRRTATTTNITTEKKLDGATETPSPEKKSPSPVKKPRRKLQRSRAFSIDRSPSPSGRICEIGADGEVGEDELCALFENVNRGS